MVLVKPAFSLEVNLLFNFGVNELCFYEVLTFHNVL